MRTITLVIASILFLFGVGLFVQALQTPENYVMTGASAVQISQVYAVATFRAVLSVAAFAASAVLAIAAGPEPTRA
jgi:hypothetical protein